MGHVFIPRPETEPTKGTRKHEMKALCGDRKLRREDIPSGFIPLMFVNFRDYMPAFRGVGFPLSRLKEAGRMESAATAATSEPAR
jgi:hypothetical protein